MRGALVRLTVYGALTIAATLAAALTALAAVGHVLAGQGNDSY